MMYLATAINDRNSIFIPTVISLLTFGRAYHSELVFSDNRAIVVTPKFIGYDIHPYDWYEWSLIPLPMITPRQEEVIRKEVDDILVMHPKYDYLGAIFGQLSRKVYSGKNRWYCSELCHHLLRDTIQGMEDDTQFISPTTLWKMVASYVGDTYPSTIPISITTDTIDA